MRLPSISAFPVLAICAQLAAASSGSSAPPSTTDVLYWPVQSPEPSVLARISYDPVSLTSTVLSYNPPPDTDELLHSESLVRIGLFSPTSTNEKKEWVGSVTSLSSLIGNRDGDFKPTLRLHLTPFNEVYHVSVSSPASSPFITSSNGRSASEFNINVELVPNKPGPHPHLDRPVTIGPNGKGIEEVVEKTFFQKYWWAVLIVAFMAMSGGGGGGAQ